MAEHSTQAASTSKTPDGGTNRKDEKSKAVTGVSAAGIRALGAQAVAFYFRAPVKAFFRNRVDYLAYARAINPRAQAQEGWSLRMTTPGLLSHAIQQHGWKFIPNHVLPPLLANVGIGAILYTTYLQTLAHLHPVSASSRGFSATETQNPNSTISLTPPPPMAVMTAGLCAGIVSTVVAAPIDAVAVRFKPSDLLKSDSPAGTVEVAAKAKHKSMWRYAWEKSCHLGLRGIAAGLPLAILKDGLGYAAFFTTFEYVKGQAYLSFLRSQTPPEHRPILSSGDNTERSRRLQLPNAQILTQPLFLLAAGITATIAQQSILHPLSRIQTIFHRALETREHKQVQAPCKTPPNPSAPSIRETLDLCKVAVQQQYAGRWSSFLFRHFWSVTIRQVPSTSAGLIIFEIMRSRQQI